MKNAKHTPGPWRLDDISDFIKGPKGVYICELCDTNSDRVQVHGKRFEANARLIAAAPELLEAVATIRCMPDIQELFESRYSKALAFDLIAQLDRAISKAKGSENE